MGKKTEKFGLEKSLRIINHDTSHLTTQAHFVSHWCYFFFHLLFLLLSLIKYENLEQ